MREASQGHNLIININCVRKYCRENISIIQDFLPSRRRLPLIGSGLWRAFIARSR